MQECVRCGYCCTKSPCGFGEWNDIKKQCLHLTDEKLCAIHDEIIKDPSSIFSPAFGAGCCMNLFNTEREKKKALDEILRMLKLFNNITEGVKGMKNTYNERKIDLYKKDGIIVDTVKVTDYKLTPYETAIKHPLHNDYNWIAVECYGNKIDAQKGHDKWVVLVETDSLPDELEDCRFPK